MAAEYDCDAEFLMISHPRSGSTWLRYCIEFLTERPTFSRLKDTNQIRVTEHIDTPFFEEYLTNEPIILKRHNWPSETSYEAEARSKRAYKKIILLIRNYKEVLLRDGYPLYKFEDLTILEPIKKDYIKLLEKYHNHEGDKSIVYYEDLLLEPQVTLDNLMQQLRLSNNYKEKLEQLLNNFEEHKNRCARKYLNMCPGHFRHGLADSAYRTDTVDNKDMYFHRRAAIEFADEGDRPKIWLRALDARIESMWPELFELYLERYREIK